MIRTIHLVLMLAWAATVCAQTPTTELQAAVSDLERLPPEVRHDVRYLSLYAVPRERRSEAARVVSYTLNAVSRTRAIAIPHTVSPTLLRFSISSYAATAEDYQAWSAAWEKLVEVDPYWHLRTEILASSGQNDPAHQAPKGQPATSIVTVDGGWIDLPTAARLRADTGSAGGLLRADYFVARATSTPVYYDLAGIPPAETDFLKSLGVDAATIDRLRANAGANLLISGVTLKPRRVIWQQGPLGGVYETLDVAQVDAERDPLRRPISTGGVDFKFDAGEWFAMGSNGLWRVALYDAQGKLQQSVPDKIAKDTSDPHGDGIVTPMISCIRCHREAGLRPFADDQTRLFSGRVDLLSSDATVVQRVAEFYDEPRLQRQMAFDRETYAQAVARAAVGMKPEELSDALALTVREFGYLPIGREQAAREIGVSEANLLEVFGGSHDPVLLTLVDGRPVLRGQWESSFAEAANAAERLRRGK